MYILITTYFYSIGIILILLILCAWFYYNIKRDLSASPLDLITDPSGRVSVSKVGLLIGLIVSTWIVIKLTTQNNLSFDIFATWLVFVSTTDGYVKWLRFRINALRENVDSEPKRKRNTSVVTTTTDVLPPMPKTPEIE